MLLRKIDQIFDGINPGLGRVYHKYHVSYTTGIAIVGMDFEDSL